MVLKERGFGIELLGAEEVAEFLGIKEPTVWRWCREGNLPCLKVGKRWRVRLEAPEGFLKEKERSVTWSGSSVARLVEEGVGEGRTVWAPFDCKPGGWI